MSQVKQRERITQNRAFNLFHKQLGYQFYDNQKSSVDCTLEVFRISG